jgi:hypothetical protein
MPDRTEQTFPITRLWEKERMSVNENKLVFPTGKGKYPPRVRRIGGRILKTLQIVRSQLCGQ